MQSDAGDTTMDVALRNAASREDPPRVLDLRVAGAPADARAIPAVRQQQRVRRLLVGRQIRDGFLPGVIPAEHVLAGANRDLASRLIGRLQTA